MDIVVINDIKQIINDPIWAITDAKAAPANDQSNINIKI